MKHTSLFKAALAALLSTSAIQAAMVTLDATNYGFYHQGGTFSSTTNHAVGWYPASSPPGELRNFFVFDLSSINGVITSATLRAFNPSTGYSSPDPTETWTLFDVSTPVASLATASGGIPVFTDLGTGTPYGAITAAFTNGANVDVLLNAAGLAYLNSVAGSGSAAIGGAITTINFANTTLSERLFNSGTGSIARQLILEYDLAPVSPVPEPSSLSAAILGLAALALARARIRKG